MNTNTLVAQEEVRKNIITLFGINKLPEDKQEEMISRIGKIIFQSVLTRVLPLLEKNDLEEYEKLIESNAMPDVVLDFFFEKVPGFLNIIGEESENFRNESLSVLEQIK
ncbi:hypothetical protein A2641_01505 [Candidatus Nomurabacteria bacterium RIFCSPHIGHO2_01_FULL_37_25]|uniref:Uncharacterized protein n=1 Tax=Candidatus Nomurabacteria bacterium RIFCSPLOWO2_01_FULL_36_16 TaxID=1801767 RepID=A0A1F6WZC8_9BACT|nr:MAG: hypothetical protein A2641_01505 [Candidatus Nomurabacteria bacterium RIFCSPHIGHO2_01_FULL_37_25]OGI75387.1 MAG: hypothetical protein A3D36_02405 [Candidatus Nomurabacteria bacterium RIFCSPHIGHO2_02_FULL_36_29]OGI87134.1 MAG: hypothetical protein A3A91_00500 [Candidatus Nomurabacteria bacterium RIFCSPLOWO2_01_FULL_36_16]OGI97304.1 MAG: hypothetical protein A3I84_00855 [Candidatus Nomurabacteria bacterium RIFCSPLOWO2_02_FULL_36_8]